MMKIQSPKATRRMSRNSLFFDIPTKTLVHLLITLGKCFLVFGAIRHTLQPVVGASTDFTSAGGDNDVVIHEMLAGAIMRSLRKDKDFPNRIDSPLHGNQNGENENMISKRPQMIYKRGGDHFLHGNVDYVHEEEELTPNIGPLQLIELEDLPVTGLTPEMALDLMFQRYHARMREAEKHRRAQQKHSGHLSHKEMNDICGTYATLECGKRVLGFVGVTGDSDTNGHSRDNTNVYRKCNLRKDFLDCIDLERKSCRIKGDNGLYPRLPPKSAVKSAQSTIWRSLWTSGGCLLVN